MGATIKGQVTIYSPTLPEPTQDVVFAALVANGEEPSPPIAKPSVVAVPSPPSSSI